MLARLDQFAEAELDFAGVDQVGHGFADELMRVGARRLPGLRLQPTAMAPAVGAMVGSIGA